MSSFEIISNILYYGNEGFNLNHFQDIVSVDDNKVKLQFNFDKRPVNLTVELENEDEKKSLIVGLMDIKANNWLSFNEPPNSNEPVILLISKRKKDGALWVDGRIRKSFSMAPSEIDRISYEKTTNAVSIALRSIHGTVAIEMTKTTTLNQLIRQMVTKTDDEVIIIRSDYPH